MIKKLRLKIKEYGLMTVGIYILKKILKKIEYKILKNKLKKVLILLKIGLLYILIKNLSPRRPLVLN